MSSHSVLIYDKDLDSGSSLRDMLASWGYQASVAQDLRTALKAVTELQPVLVADGSSGSLADDFALVREIRWQDADLPVVLLADQSSGGPVEAIQQEGVYPYFQRPIGPHKLRLVLDRALELAVA